MEQLTQNQQEQEDCLERQLLVNLNQQQVECSETQQQLLQQMQNQLQEDYLQLLKY